MAFGVSRRAGNNTIINVPGVDVIDGRLRRVAQDTNQIMSTVGSGFGPVEIEGEGERLAVAAWDIGSISIPHEPSEELPTEPPIGDEGGVTDHLTGVTAGNSPSFDIALGAADADRMIAVVIGWKNTGTGTSSIDGVTVGASALTRAVRAVSGAANSNCEVWYGHVASGTSAALAIEFSGSTGPQRCHSIGIYRVVGLDGNFTPAATLDDTSSGATVSDDAAVGNGLAILGAFGATTNNAEVAVNFGAGIVRDVPAHTAGGFVNRGSSAFRLHGTVGRAPTTEVAETLSATAESTPTGWTVRLAAAVWALPPE